MGSNASSDSLISHSSVLPPQKLLSHPTSTGIFSPELQWEVTPSRDDNLFSFEFKFDRGKDEILFPPKSAVPIRADGLWQKTCFEVFFTCTGTETYWEINASPSGDWNCYRFERYRLNGQAENLVQGESFRDFTFDEAGRKFRFSIDLSKIVAKIMTTMITPSAKDSENATPDLCFGVAAVVEKKDHSIAYLALNHADVAPNFHLRKSFILRI